jgi:predicted transcriptional regulator
MKIEIHTTKDTLYKLTNGYRDFFIDDVLNNIRYNINIGWGIGNTKTHSESNARNANIKSAELGGNCTYIIDDTNQLIGPLYSENKIINAADSLIVDKLTSYIPLSSANISKIMSVIDERGTNEITAKILSDYLNVTLRTANRILNVLHESEVATLANSNVSKKHRGRPEKVYQINFSRILNKMSN